MKPGLLVISHGSREAGWVELVDETVATARAALGDALPVEAVFLELVEGRLIQDGIDCMKTAGVTHLLALPLFVSSGSTHVDEIGWALGAYLESRTETELERYQTSSMELTYGKPMDDAAEIVSVVLDRLQEMSKEPAKESILLVGHGSEEAGFREAWERGLTSIADQVIKLGGYATCSTALLLPNQVPERLEMLRRQYPLHEVLVMALFLSQGYFTKEVIPRRLDGVDFACRYDGLTLMPHPNIASWIVGQTRAWLDSMR